MPGEEGRAALGCCWRPGLAASSLHRCRHRRVRRAGPVARRKTGRCHGASSCRGSSPCTAWSASHCSARSRRMLPRAPSRPAPSLRRRPRSSSLRRRGARCSRGPRCSCSSAMLPRWPWSAPQARGGTHRPLWKGGPEPAWGWARAAVRGDGDCLAILMVLSLMDLVAAALPTPPRSRSWRICQRRSIPRTLVILAAAAPGRPHRCGQAVQRPRRRRRRARSLG